MKIYKSRQLCNGCSNCANKCPQKCIKMVADDKGFLYPVVDESKCINCLKCQKVCPTYSEKEEKSVSELVSYTTDKPEVLEKCSSGGAFGMIADKILSNDGYVCGAVWTPDFKVEHIVTNSSDDVKKMYGSKYLQSNLGNCFSEIERLLKEEKQVLFSGTPCQALALRKFLNKDYSNLTVVDFICHSIPSPKVFEGYKNSLEKENGKLTNFSFRDKTEGWEHYSLKAQFGDKTQLYPHKGNLYMALFLDGIIHRDCCNQCIVKTTTGYVSDITLADYWGVKKLVPQVYNEKGVSAILVNTEKGRGILHNLNLTECDLNAFIKVNTAYNTTVTFDPKMELFWKIFNKKGFADATNRVYKKSIIIRLKTAMKNLLIIVKKHQ